MKQDLELLLSCRNQKEGDFSLVARSAIRSDVLLVNQYEEKNSEVLPYLEIKTLGEFRCRKYNLPERGLSRSRNFAIRMAQAELCLLADDDELFGKRYRERIVESFSRYPHADVLIFAIANRPKRVRHTVHRVYFPEILKVSSVQIAFRRKRIVEQQIIFDEAMGAGTGNGAEEEIKFLWDCLKHRLQIVFVPMVIAKIREGMSSTWFHGYDAVFFEQRGMTTRYLFGQPFALCYGMYYILTKKALYQDEISAKQAWNALRYGVKQNRLNESERERKKNDRNTIGIEMKKRRERETRRIDNRNRPKQNRKTETEKEYVPAREDDLERCTSRKIEKREEPSNRTSEHETGRQARKKVVTFVVAAYNSERYLNKCLDSFLVWDASGRLGEERLEVLIVNDGSQDRTEEIARSYQNRYPEVFRVMTKANGGHGSVINCAIQEAVGTYFKVIDADDWVETEHLCLYLDQLEQTEAEVVLTHYKTVHIKTGEILWWKTFVETYETEYTLWDVKRNWKCMDRCLTFHGITYRTEFYRKRGVLLEESVYYEDQQYATIPCCYAKRIQPLDCSLYFYRIGDEAQSVSERNQYLRRAHMKTVLFALCRYYHPHRSQMGEAGRYYYEEKVSRLLVSYLVTVLLGSPVRLNGRKEARETWKQIRMLCPEMARKSRSRYAVLLVCNRLSIRVGQYHRVLQSRIYRWIRRNPAFQTEKRKKVSADIG